MRSENELWRTAGYLALNYCCNVMRNSSVQLYEVTTNVFDSEVLQNRSCTVNVYRRCPLRSNRLRTLLCCAVIKLLSRALTVPNTSTCLLVYHPKQKFRFDGHVHTLCKSILANTNEKMYGLHTNFARQCSNRSETSDRPMFNYSLHC